MAGARPKTKSVSDYNNVVSYESFYLTLLEENRALKDRRLCKVCLDRNLNTVFLPCGHYTCCDICSPSIIHCPMCRKFIKGTVKVQSFSGMNVSDG